MKTSHTCPKCQGTDVVRAQPQDRNDGLTGNFYISTYAKPDAIIFKGEHSTDVIAYVCRGCGFMELYAEKPQLLDKPQGT